MSALALACVLLSLTLAGVVIAFAFFIKAVEAKAIEHVRYQKAMTVQLQGKSRAMDKVYNLAVSIPRQGRLGRAKGPTPQQSMQAMTDLASQIAAIARHHTNHLTP